MQESKPSHIEQRIKTYSDALCKRTISTLYNSVKFRARDNPTSRIRLVVVVILLNSKIFYHTSSVFIFDRIAYQRSIPPTARSGALVAAYSPLVPSLLTDRSFCYPLVEKYGLSIFFLTCKYHQHHAIQISDAVTYLSLTDTSYILRSATF